MDKETQDQLFREDLGRSRKELQRKFPEFDTYPRPAQESLMDMQFNMGDTKFQREYYDTETKGMKKAWPKLFDALEKRDSQAAGNESKRGQVNDDRNISTKNRFYRAAEEDGQ